MKKIKKIKPILAKRIDHVKCKICDRDTDCSLIDMDRSVCYDCIVRMRFKREIEEEIQEPSPISEEDFIQLLMILKEGQDPC